MESQIDISNLSFNRASTQNNDFKKYEINVDLEEESSTDRQTTLKYSLDLTSTPKNSVISITGYATFSGNQDELENYLQKSDNSIPKPVVNIYEEIFPLMYIISKNMNMPSPAHTISQNNITESIDGVEPQVTETDETINSDGKDSENLTNMTKENNVIEQNTSDEKQNTTE